MRIAKRLGELVTRPPDERTLPGFFLHRLRWAILSFVALVGIGTIGYVAIAHFGAFDALYMTVITLSTVGFSEVHPLGVDGRIFTIAIIVAGFGTFVFAAASMTNLFTSGEALQHLKRSRGRRMRHEIQDHIIVVGFGRVGQAVAHAVHEIGRPCLVIDLNPDREELIQAAGHVAMIGDATDETNLREAGIERATALIAAAELDQINLIVTLTARAIRPELRIVSRVNEPAWRERMVRAGADVAESPYIPYGMSLASAASSQAILDVHRLPLLGLAAEEIEISTTSTLIGSSLHEVSDRFQGVFVVGLRREQQFQRWHEVNGPIGAGDILVALGDNDSLIHLARSQ